MTALLCGPGGVRAVIAEHLLLKQQLLVLHRPRQRAPHRQRVTGGCSDSGHSSSAQDESERSPSECALPGRLTGRAPAADGDAVAVEDERAGGVAAATPRASCASRIPNSLAESRIEATLRGAWRLAYDNRGAQPRVVEGPHAVDLRRRTHGGPCRAEQCPLDLPLPGLGPAPSGGLTTNSRRTGGGSPDTARLCAATRAQATRRADPRSRYTRRRGGPTPPATGTRETARHRPRVVGPQYALHPDRTAHRLALRARLPGVAWSAAVSVGHHLHHETAVIARSPLLHVVHCPHRHPVRLEFPIFSLNPELRPRGVAPDVWPTLSRA